MFSKPLLLRLLYPVIMGCVITLHFILLKMGFSMIWSSYIPVVLSTISIIYLENKIPFQKSWLPNKSDFKTDISFFITLKVLFPQFLLVIAGFALLDSGLLTQSTLSSIWVHHWPVYIQALLMFLIVDFSTYWFHRALHGFPFLWKFHAIHHSVHKLYWLNVNHDHPVEAFGLFAFGSMPFYFLGIDERVFGLFIVFFGSHAFFQHCNIDLKWGMLNKILSTSELHRWHHSREIKISENNFGNTFIIWDIMFGTWYFPYANFSDIGLKNPNYPTKFLDSIKSPHVIGLIESDVYYKPVEKSLDDIRKSLILNFKKFFKRMT